MKQRKIIISIVIIPVMIICAYFLFFVPKGKDCYEVRKAEAGALEYIYAPNLHQKIILFESEWPGKGGVKISEGNGMPYMSGIVEITDERISVGHLDEVPVTDYTEAHGLRPTGKISIEIRQKADRTAKITLRSGEKEYSAEVPYQGHGELIRAEAGEGNLRNARLRVECPEYKEKLWAFGDSYFDMWVPYATRNGLDGVMWDGYSGRPSAEAVESLKENLKYGKPEKILWCMGMNDPDEGETVNPEWLASWDEVTGMCKEKGIEFIPMTIPNVPERSHRAKNEMIRQSGYRIVDAAKEIGAEENEHWDEQLAPGIVHPSEAGSKRIAEIVMSELKSIRQGGRLKN